MSNVKVVVSTKEYPLASHVAKALHLPFVRLEKESYPDGEIAFFYNGPDRPEEVILFQELAKDPNRFFVETLFAIRAIQHKVSSKITLVIPYLPYSRGDGIQLGLIIEAFQSLGIHSLFTMDPHNTMVLYGSHVDIVQLSAMETIVAVIKKEEWVSQESLVVVAPDLGGAKLASAYAKKLNCSLAVVEKKRKNPHTVTAHSLLGCVRDKNVLLADDICSTAATLSSAAMFCREKGAKKIYAAVTHGLFLEESLTVLEKSVLSGLYTTDTITQTSSNLDRCRAFVVSVTENFAIALFR